LLSNTPASDLTRLRATYAWPWANMSGPKSMTALSMLSPCTRWMVIAHASSKGNWYRSRWCLLVLSRNLEVAVVIDTKVWGTTPPTMPSLSRANCRPFWPTLELSKRTCTAVGCRAGSSNRPLRPLKPNNHPHHTFDILLR
jgi:hypothetical protein